MGQSPRLQTELDYPSGGSGASTYQFRPLS